VISTLDDLSGQEVYVPKSSSYWEHLEKLNARFSGAGKKPIKLTAASENLEDEDLLEMDSPTTSAWATSSRTTKADISTTASPPRWA
jgi:hypothetical protein